MKVKLLMSRSGADGAQNAGDEIEVSNNEAKRMIEAGQAVPAVGDVKPEKAVKRHRGSKVAKE